MRPHSSKELKETIEMWRGFIAHEKPEARILDQRLKDCAGESKKRCQFNQQRDGKPFMTIGSSRMGIGISMTPTVPINTQFDV